MTMKQGLPTLVVKFYATGFIIATPTAFIAEGILINIMLFVAYIFYAIGAVIWEEDFLDWFSQNYVPFWIAGELLNAFLVAAITEELCKYYAFRFVEHPDLIFLTGLDRARQDSEHLVGGEKNYAFNSHNVSSDLHTGSEFDLDRSVAAGYSQKKNMHRGNRSQARAAMSVGLNQDDNGNDEEEVRSIRQRAAAVTTAMIGTAVGLACAENFLYVFLFGGANSGGEEMAILAGDAETGVTIMQMDAGLDTGPELLREAVPITAEANPGMLHDTLAELGGRLIVEALRGVADGLHWIVPLLRGEV